MLINCSWLTQTHTHLRTHTYIGTQRHTHSHSLSHTRTILCCRYFCNICIIAFVAFILSVLAQRGMCQIFAQHSPSPSPFFPYSTIPLRLPLVPLLCTARQCVVYVKRLRFCGRAIFGQFHTSCNRSCSRRHHTHINIL